MVSEESTAPAAAAGVVAGAPRGRYATKWLRRTSVVLVAFWTAAVVVPEVLQLGAAWRAFGTGLIIPGCGLAVCHPRPRPSVRHRDGRRSRSGHHRRDPGRCVRAASLARGCRHECCPVPGRFGTCHVGCAGCRRDRRPCRRLPGVTDRLRVGHRRPVDWTGRLGHAGGSDSRIGLGRRRPDSVHGGMLGPSMGGMLGPRTWLPWSVWAVAIGGLAVASGRAAIQRRGATERGVLRSGYGQVDTEGPLCVRGLQAVALDGVGRGQVVTEATADQRGLMRYLLSVAAQPADDWRGFRPGRRGPLQQYRYQLNSLRGGPWPPTSTRMHRLSSDR